MVGAVGDEREQRARMRLGVRAALRQEGGARGMSGISLVALLCAAALAPVFAAGAAAGPVVVAGIGVVGSVGAGFLTDAVKAALDKLRRDGTEVSPESVEAELAARLKEALERGGEEAAALRREVAAVLRSADAPGALLEAADQDSDLLPTVMEALAGLADQFGDVAFMVDDLRRIPRGSGQCCGGSRRPSRWIRSGPGRTA